MVKINHKVQKILKKYNIEVRIGKSPKACNIKYKHPGSAVAGAYFPGTGVIWLNSKNYLTKKDANFVVLHELGHVLFEQLKHFSKCYNLGNITNIKEEHMCNGVAIGIMFALGVNAKKEAVQTLINYSKQTKKEILL